VSAGRGRCPRRARATIARILGTVMPSRGWPSAQTSSQATIAFLRSHSGVGVHSVYHSNCVATGLRSCHRSLTAEAACGQPVAERSQTSCMNPSHPPLPDQKVFCTTSSADAADRRYPRAE
jgi:hypothetical protein